MKIISINKKKGNALVCDCYSDNGYVKRYHGSLPDIDSDFDADRRDEVKSYLERRYNKHSLQRVFSVGTFTTEKIKSAIKDVARVHRIPQSTANYITAILKDDMTWTDVMRLAASEEKVKKFVMKYPDVFEEIMPILGQARSAGIHASALIITPEYVKGERVECFDLLPIRKMDDLLVSEISGTEVDAIGILKNDVLGIRELSRLSSMLNLIKEEYGVQYSILEISSKYLNDSDVYKLIREGNTQGVFQISGEGMTKYVKYMRTDNINDLIATIALHRPGPLSSGAADNYAKAKRGEIIPEYLWGTYDILKDTFGQMCYQEQISMVAQKIGNLNLADGVNLVKALSKKKLEKVRKFHDKFVSGAKANGCPQEAITQIWSEIEDAAKYSFNKSHATAYGLTAFVGAWLKTHYSTAFYTVVLRDQDDDKMPLLISEIEKVNGTELVHPDINISGVDFTADFKNNKIYWSLSRIKYVGPRAVQYIIQERNLYGDFCSLEDFIKRIFKSKFKDFNDDGTEEQRERCPVTARIVKNLIFVGAFDNCERINVITDRYRLFEDAAKYLKFEMPSEFIPEDLRGKHYYWSKKQIELSGYGAVDYKQIYDDTEKPASVKSCKYLDFSAMDDMFLEQRRCSICATITSVTSKAYNDKRAGEKKSFGKIELQQNTYTNILTIWESWEEVKEQFKDSVGHFIIAIANIKWSDYDSKNVFQINKLSYIQVI